MGGMKQVPDVDRKVVYAAEGKVSQGARTKNLDEATAYVEAVVFSDYWYQTFGTPLAVDIVRRDNRLGAFARRNTDHVIELFLQAKCTEATMLHELAHRAAELRNGRGCGHDLAFRAEHLALQAYCRGAKCAAELAASYAKHGLSVPPPVDDVTKYVPFDHPWVDFTVEAPQSNDESNVDVGRVNGAIPL